MYTNDEQGESFAEAIVLLGKHFEVRKNVPYKISICHRAKQNGNKSIEQFATLFRKLTLYCEYGDSVDEQISDKIIDSCNS